MAPKFVKVSPAMMIDRRMKLTHHRVVQAIQYLGDWETGLSICTASDICRLLGWATTPSKTAQVRRARTQLLKAGYLEQKGGGWVCLMSATRVSPDTGGVSHQTRGRVSPDTGACLTRHGGVSHSTRYPCLTRHG